MIDGRDAARGAAALAVRGLGIKVGVGGAALLVLFLALLGPFAIGASSAAASCGPTQPGEPGSPIGTGPIAEQQAANARLIDGVAIARGLPGQATLVALMTALQESTLLNINYGDRDSLGLFQQRPSAGWGTPEQIMDPTYAAGAFFGGAAPPEPRGLVDIDGWPAMPLTVAAQKVQVSAFPDAYARHEPTARAIAAANGIDLNRPGDPYAGRAGGAPGPSGGPTGTLPPGDCGSGDLPPGTGPVNGTWPPEECSVIPDPTTGRGCLTPRTAIIVQVINTMPHTSISCWDPHLQNPNSDHPRGKACDTFFGPGGQLPSAEGKAQGDALAALFIQTAGQYGVNYVIWYGNIWQSRTGQWTPYNGGGVYDPGSITGEHYDHVHVSMF